MLAPRNYCRGWVLVARRVVPSLTSAMPGERLNAR